LWAALALLDQQPDTWLEVWHALAPDAVQPMLKAPWYHDYDGRVPIYAELPELQRLIRALEEATQQAEVELVELVSRVVFPDEFNDLVRHYDSKGAALTHLTLELVTRLIAPLEEGPISIVCDKHGGRNCYGRALAQHFPDPLIEVRGESRTQSVYRFGPPDRRVEFRFCVRAESHLQVALASMAAKYLRELAMRAFNSFWRDRVADLRPTAGYPEDAKRFKAEIAAVQRELGIDDHLLWRER
jgi:ribonuclease HII